jgi:radical SAM-linked protein
MPEDRKLAAGNSDDGSSEGGFGALPSTRVTAAIRFRIAGAMRFLSHAETFRVFHRACARAVLPVCYTEGFNPHPRLSLPLPRPVGVESDDELLVARLCEERGAGPVEDRTEREAAIRQALTEQLPDGIQVLSVALTAGASFQPQRAEYVLPVRVENDPELAERLTGALTRVMTSERCAVERSSGESGVARSIDVRPFLCSIRLEGANLIVEHRTGGAGSIRVDEILQLLGLRIEDLAGPVRRTNVVWETTRKS